MAASCCMANGWARAASPAARRTSALRSRSTAPLAACSSACWRSCSVSPFSSQRQQPVAIDVLLDVIGEEIERRIDVGLVVEVRGLGAELREPVPPLAIVGQQAMDVATGDAAFHGARVVPVELEQRRRGAG